MKGLLDIQDNKANSLLDVLNSLPHVKELKLVCSGKKKARNAEDFLNEL